jgi:hypothetical protein
MVEISPFHSSSLHSPLTIPSLQPSIQNPEFHASLPALQPSVLFPMSSLPSLLTPTPISSSRLPIQKPQLHASLSAFSSQPFPTLPNSVTSPATRTRPCYPFIPYRPRSQTRYLWAEKSGWRLSHARPRNSASIFFDDPRNT